MECSTYITAFRKSVFVHPCVMEVIDYKPLFGLCLRPSCPAETKSTWKYFDVQKRRKQFEIIDN